MARKTGESSGKGGLSWKDTLHMIEFSFEDEIMIKEWFGVADRCPLLTIEELVDSGWSVRITPPKTGDDYWATATAKSVSKALDGHSFSVRYPDFSTAVVLLGYAIQVQLKEGHLDQMIKPKSRAWLED